MGLEKGALWNTAGCVSPHADMWILKNDCQYELCTPSMRMCMCGAELWVWRSTDTVISITCCTVSGTPHLYTLALLPSFKELLISFSQSLAILPALLWLQGRLIFLFQLHKEVFAFVYLFLHCCPIPLAFFLVLPPTLLPSNHFLEVCNPVPIGPASCVTETHAEVTSCTHYLGHGEWVIHPCFAISSAWVPFSATMSSFTVTIRSAPRIVESRCATKTVGWPLLACWREGVEISRRVLEMTSEKSGQLIFAVLVYKESCLGI